MKKIMEVNLWQVARITKEIIPELRKNEIDSKKRLVFHSSYLGRLVEPGNIPFALSKVALEGLFDAIRLENYHHDISGIHNLICSQSLPFFVLNFSFDNRTGNFLSELAESSFFVSF